MKYIMILINYIKSLFIIELDCGNSNDIIFNGLIPINMSDVISTYETIMDNMLYTIDYKKSDKLYIHKDGDKIVSGIKPLRQYQLRRTYIMYLYNLLLKIDYEYAHNLLVTYNALYRYIDKDCK